MDRPTLRRREFLIAATTGASLLLHRVPAVGAQSTGGRAPAVALIPRRLLFADPARTWVRISPDGTRIAFLAPVNEVSNLWVGPIGDVTKARPHAMSSARVFAESTRCGMRIISSRLGEISPEPRRHGPGAPIAT
jgi:hypothetical protein